MLHSSHAEMENILVVFSVRFKIVWIDINDTYGEYMRAVMYVLYLCLYHVCTDTMFNGFTLIFSSVCMEHISFVVFLSLSTLSTIKLFESNFSSFFISVLPQSIFLPFSKQKSGESVFLYLTLLFRFFFYCGAICICNVLYLWFCFDSGDSRGVFVYR